MKAKKFISIFMCFVIILPVFSLYSSAQEAFEVIEGEYAPGEVMFLYTQTADSKGNLFSESNIPDELKICGIKALEETPADCIYETGTTHNSDGTYTKTAFITGYTDDDVSVCCGKLNHLSSTSKVSPNYILHEDTVTIPPEITNPTNVFNTYTKWWFEATHIQDTWEKYDTMGEGAVIAVIDSGVYVDNPEIKDNIWEDAHGHRGYDAVTQTYDSTPATAHGGNVAGIIAGAAGYNPLIIGVAPKAKIMPIKISTNAYTMMSNDVISGINYAISNGADIITMSLGTSSNITSFRDACDAAYNAGIIVFGSAGNNGKNTSEIMNYPGAYSSVICVMAHGENNVLCDFSNYDSTCTYYDISAPGYAIIGLPPDPSAIDSATAMAGTSQATPIVAGIAALYLSVYPDHTPDEFRNALLNGCTDTVRSNPTVSSTTYTFPRADALKTLDYNNDPEPSVSPCAGTTTVVDDENDIIYGLEENFTSIDDYVSVLNGDCEFIPTVNGNGTGSIFRVYSCSGSVYKEYRIVIFGDTNGDSVCDARDCAVCGCIMNGYNAPYYLRFAADADFDDSVTQDDYDIMFGCGIGNDFVAQIR